MSTDSVAMSSGSAPTSAPGSPKSRLKFLCSHGGRILPRPSDAHLKYVGGETRVISVPTDISFQELMKKLTYQIDGEMRLKYQVGSEDLDALVSVGSDEDLRHMLDDIDRHNRSSLPKLRAFLFPLNPSPDPDRNSQAPDHQRYIDAINGVIRTGRIHAVQHGSRVSSACSSPRSPDSCTSETLNQEPVAHIPSSYYLNTGRAATGGMHRVRSSPSICSLSNGPQPNSSGGPHCHHFSPQPSPSFYYGLARPKSPTPDRLISVRSVGRAEGVRYQVEPLPVQYYSPTAASRQNRGNGLLQCDEWGHVMDRRTMADRNVSLATSLVSASPLGQGHQAWDRDV
ncbi:Octicosapeptide/Phox/Bem1p family protein [Striga hermonthica]|uniref:Octicosapeptide/Phox/Bem1p family protein n=1 Tax=Striga hermonthica TaxID=68872 RepID=A0A9N7MTT7_STRHE|nr:Octicosapeptide/Phox/Bem1p family protein [Striga hermonthica]